MSDVILDVQGLVGGYGKMTILNGTSFSVPSGTITTVIGPNGAGKSTVFKAIFGLLKLREGKVVFKGRDVTGLSQRELLTSGICYVPQGRNIFPELSVRDNIQLGAAFLGQLVSAEGGSLEMAAAAYNAGAGRVAQWTNAYGDPRSGADMVDWVERIPFDETRDYVMRVVENYGVYRTRLAEAPEPRAQGAIARR